MPWLYSRLITRSILYGCDWKNSIVLFSINLFNASVTVRSLCSLEFSDNNLGMTFAKDLFLTLLNLSSSISVLDLSYNNVSFSSLYFVFLFININLQ